MKTKALTTIPDFEDFRRTLRIPGLDRKIQIEKAQGFIDDDYNSLHKHFIRWASTDLIPAALMAKLPFAQAVA